MISNFLQINNLTFSYSNSSTQLFDDFSLTFYDGWTTLAGSNGTGKSTLLKLIASQLSQRVVQYFIKATANQLF